MDNGSGQNIASDAIPLAQEEAVTQPAPFDTDDMSDEIDGLITLYIS